MSAVFTGHWVIERLAVVLITIGQAFEILFHEDGEIAAVLIGDVKAETYLAGADPQLQLGNGNQQVYAVMFQFCYGSGNVFSPDYKVKRTRADMGDGIDLTNGFQQFHIYFIQAISDTIPTEPYLHKKTFTSN